MKAIEKEYQEMAVVFRSEGLPDAAQIEEVVFDQIIRMKEEEDVSSDD